MNHVPATEDVEGDAQELPHKRLTAEESPQLATHAVIAAWCKLGEAGGADPARRVPSGVGDHLSLAWPSEPVPGDSHAPAPGAEGHGMAHKPSQAPDPEVVRHRLAAPVSFIINYARS